MIVGNSHVSQNTRDMGHPTLSTHNQPLMPARPLVPPPNRDALVRYR
jgi:hypothetical protein